MSGQRTGQNSAVKVHPGGMSWHESMPLPVPLAALLGSADSHTRAAGMSWHESVPLPVPLAALLGLAGAHIRCTCWAAL